MKRMNRYTGASKLLVLLLCAVLLVGTLPAFSALGAKKAKTGATKANAGAGSITVSLKTDVSELPPNAKVAFTLYKVAAADPTDYDGWKFDEAFTSYGKKIKAAWKKSTLQDEVDKLAEFISEEKYAGTTQDISSGSTTFVGLEDGLYVGVLTKAPKGLTANAALYAIPSWNADKTELLHALTPIPKDEYTPEIRPDRTDDEVTVTKTDGVQQIPGATFTLSDGDNKVIFTGGQFKIRTADEKMAKFLPEVGGATTLTLKEEEAPTGYTKSDKEYKVVITAKESTDWDGDIKVITTAYTITVDDQKNITVENPPVTDVDREDDSVTVTKTNGKKEIPGATFTLYDGSNEIKVFHGGHFTISTDNEYLKDVLPAAGDSKELTLKETVVPDGHKGNNTEYTVVITAEKKAPEWNDDHTKRITVTAYNITIIDEDGEENESVTVVNPPIPEPRREDHSVTVKKTDGKDPISATFTLYDGSTEIRTYTNEEFEIWTDDEALKDVLPAAGQSKKLTLKETGVPAGHKGSNTAYEVVITAEEKEPEWNDDNTKLITVTVYTITIDGKESITVENPPDTDGRKDDYVTVEKTDGEEKISGAKFTLYDDSTEITEFSGEKFVISTTNDKLQKYLPKVGGETTLTLKETTTPKGYKPSDDEYSVVIKATEKTDWNDDHTMEVPTTIYTITIDGEKSATVVNTPITDEGVDHTHVTVYKHDDTDAPLEGAVFTLYNGDNPINTYGGAKVSDFTIDTNDPKLANFLPKVGEDPTTLTLKETTTPKGYKPSDDEYSVVIEATEKTDWNDDHSKLVTTTIYTITINGEKSLTVVNTPDTEEKLEHNHVTVYKQDDSGSPLTGAIFTLYSDTTKIRTYGGAKVSDFTIDTDDPKLANFLPKVGESTTLTLKETKAPSGYKLSSDEYDVVIKATQATDWNDDHTKLVTTTTYTIAFKDDAKKDDVKTLEVVNEPTTTTPSPTPDGDTPDTPGGGGGVPEPGPTPEPTTDISGTKVWADDGNAHKVRPGAIEITLLADGSPVSATPTWTKDGDRWTYTFTGLPQYSSEGNEISYTVEETPVDYYKSSVSGMTITNELIPSVPSRYIDLSGQKTWNDSENKSGKRPTTITIRLLRDGEAIESRSVTAGSDWSYTFQHLPVDDGYGHTYTYEIREDGVPGYFTRYDGTNVTNSVIDGSVPPPITDNPTPGGTTPERPEDIPDRRTGTPVPRFEELGDEELEELFDMFGYGTPLYGMLGTGDQIPIWVWICSGVGVAALVLFLITGRKKKKAK